MRIVPGNAQHIGKRAEQQDAFGFSNLQDTERTSTLGALAVVADGMGGMAFGHEASHIAKKAVLDAFAEVPTDSDPDQFLYDSLMVANTLVYEMAERAGVPRLAGTTLIAAIVQNDLLHWISVGDSRIYLFRNSELTQLNTEHTFGNQLLRAAQLGKATIAEAQTHPERHALTSYIGQIPLSEIDRPDQPLQLQRGDQILICSDGLFGALSDDEICQTMTDDPQRSADLLLQKTLDKRRVHQDNVTIVVLAFDPEKNPRVFQTTRRAESKNRQTWIIASVLALLAAIAIWWLLRPPSFGPGAYVSKEKYSMDRDARIQNVRGALRMPGTVMQGEVVWKGSAQSGERDLSIILDSDTITVGHTAGKLAGVSRDDDSGRDYLVFSETTDTERLFFIQLDPSSRIDTVAVFPASVKQLENLGYLYSLPVSGENTLLSPASGSLKSDIAFTPKRIRWREWTEHNQFANTFFGITPETLINWPLTGMVSEASGVTTEEFGSLRGRYQNISFTDQRFQFADLMRSERWEVDAFYFEDLAGVNLLVTAIDKDNSLLMILHKDQGPGSTICMPTSTAESESDRLNIGTLKVTTDCGESQSIEVNLNALRVTGEADENI